MTEPAGTQAADHTADSAAKSPDSGVHPPALPKERVYLALRRALGAVRAFTFGSRKRSLISGLTALAVVAAVVVTLTVHRKDSPPPAPDMTPPAGALEDGGILLGTDLVPGNPAPTAEEAVTVELVYSLGCQQCALLQQAHGRALALKAEAGEIRLVIHLVDGGETDTAGDEYSWRGMLAADTVAALAPDKFWMFLEALWGGEPTGDQAGDGLTDQAIADLASRSGLDADVIAKLVDSPVVNWARWSSEQGLDLTAEPPAVRMSFAGSAPEVWNGWLLETVNAAGETQHLSGPLDRAVANVKEGKKPDAAQ
ncbi:MAG: DsbA family protein [Bifidobacteriaceae bacterium]|jgi:protein-disulfide isomerase|nr:DsbA family protein [Bifidobacteriaceae bacterium]